MISMISSRDKLCQLPYEVGRQHNEERYVVERRKSREVACEEGEQLHEKVLSRETDDREEKVVEEDDVVVVHRLGRMT